MAAQAQLAYQYELLKDDQFIQNNYWDTLHKGLLAGESLMLSLNQLEKAYLNGNSRRFEISKTIELSQLAPEALANLKKDKNCTFDLKPELFDEDFPDHYGRQIKSIAISFPAITGPYQNFNATLTQTSNTVKLKDGTQRKNYSLNQQVALSRGVNDSGVFQLNFQDERYLPFEGTGAISDWTLAIAPNSKIDLESLTDVIINLEYTALA